MTLYMAKKGKRSVQAVADSRVLEAVKANKSVQMGFLSGGNGSRWNGTSDNATKSARQEAILPKIDAAKMETNAPLLSTEGEKAFTARITIRCTARDKSPTIHFLLFAPLLLTEGEKAFTAQRTIRYMARDKLPTIHVLLFAPLLSSEGKKGFTAYIITRYTTKNKFSIIHIILFALLQSMEGGKAFTTYRITRPMKRDKSPIIYILIFYVNYLKLIAYYFFLNIFLLIN